MYNKLYDLLVEGLSGASRSWLKRARNTKKLIKQQWKERDEDAKNNGPLYLNDDPITTARINSFKPIEDKIKKSRSLESKVGQAIPRKRSRENLKTKQQFQGQLGLIHRHTAKVGKEKAAGFRKPLADKLKYRRNQLRLPMYKIRDKK